MPVVDTALSGRSEPVEYELTDAECYGCCANAGVCEMQLRRMTGRDDFDWANWSRMADDLGCSQQCEYFED